MTQPHGIFLSYRREETAAHAGRIYDRLAEAFGEETVFMDVDSIGLGLDFATVLDEAVSSCAVMLVLIGRGWAEIGDERGRRLDDPDDYVRQEVEAGLRREIRVVPVLLSGTILPAPEALPEELRPLARRQAFALPDETFRSQVQALVERLRPLVAPGAPERGIEPGPNWTAELIEKSIWHRVLRVRLTSAEQILKYKVGLFKSDLYLNDVELPMRVVQRTEEKGEPFDCEFQLPDRDTALPCTLKAYLGYGYIQRVMLTVDGRLLYDEAR